MKKHIICHLSYFGLTLMNFDLYSDILKTQPSTSLPLKKVSMFILCAKSQRVLIHKEKKTITERKDSNVKHAKQTKKTGSNNYFFCCN